MNLIFSQLITILVSGCSRKLLFLIDFKANSRFYVQFYGCLKNKRGSRNTLNFVERKNSPARLFNFWILLARSFTESVVRCASTVARLSFHEFILN